MTHWYRLPNSISVGKLFFRSKQAFFVDHGLTTEFMKHLPTNASFLPKGNSEGKQSRESFIRLCQEKHAILVTADEEYAQALTDEPNGAWGVICFLQMRHRQFVSYFVCPLEILRLDRPKRAQTSSNSPDGTACCSILVAIRLC
jgi:hypothetical protein